VNYPSLTQGASPFPSCLHGRASSGSSGVRFPIPYLD